MKRNFIIVFLLAAFSAGCASGQSLSREMAGMQGTDVDDAIAAWGPPEAETMIAGQQVLIWKDRTSDYFEVAQGIVLCERMLAVDTQGTVTGWRWRGDACEAVPVSERVFAQTMVDADRP